MPVPLIRNVLAEGLDSVPYWPLVLKLVAGCIVLYYAKVYFQGASNLSERNMHGKVVLVTVCNCIASDLWL